MTNSGVAHAQNDDGKGITIETFKPSSSVHSLFELTLPETKDRLEWSAGALLFYSHHPVRRESRLAGQIQSTGYPVRLRINADLMFALGLFGFMEVGIGLPVIAFQDGEGGQSGGADAARAGIGDPRLEIKGRFLDTELFDLGAGVIATFPTGHFIDDSSLLGARLPTVEPRLLASVSPGPLIIGLNAGFMARPHAEMGDYEQRHAVTWNVGVAWDVFDYHEPGGLRLALETNGEAGISFATLAETPMEVLVGAKYRLENDMILTAGGGPGISTAVGTPAFRVFLGLAYDDVLRNCAAGPEDFDGFEDYDKCIDPDNDHDGILDGDDPCPNEAEDVDHFEDTDGCPDPDNDGDSIPDALDKCPMIGEDKDNYEDEDGCPEEGPGKPTVKITDTQLLISSKIYFDFDRATIKEVSYPILDAVAEALLANPQIKQVRVEGHTDNEGTEDYNVQLSRDRAKAVVEYLIGKGVPAERLTYEGYGFSKPKASNKTAEGRAINRRVEFTILKKD